MLRVPLPTVKASDTRRELSSNEWVTAAVRISETLLIEAASGVLTEKLVPYCTTEGLPVMARAGLVPVQLGFARRELELARIELLEPFE